MKRIVSLILAAMMLLGMVSFASADEPVKLTALFIAHPLTKHVDEMKWVSGWKSALASTSSGKSSGPTGIP